jgi:hypothetical protein
MYRTLLILFLLCTCGAARAQTAEETRTQVLREAGADGALIALALHCKHPKDAVNSLAEKLEALTMALARSKSVTLDGNTYYDLVHDGFLHTREVLAVADAGEATYRELCAGAQARIEKKLAQ